MWQHFLSLLEWLLRNVFYCVQLGVILHSFWHEMLLRWVACRDSLRLFLDNWGFVLESWGTADACGVARTSTARAVGGWPSALVRADWLGPWFWAFEIRSRLIVGEILKTNTANRLILELTIQVLNETVVKGLLDWAYLTIEASRTIRKWFHIIIWKFEF